MIGIDELGATFARLPVAEVMAEHPPADAVAGFENHNIHAIGDQRLGTAQAGQPATHDRYVRH